MYGLTRKAALTLGVVLAFGLLLAGATGTVAAAEESGVAATHEVVAQQDNETDGNETDLPAEPPTEPLPGADYLRQENDTEEKIELGKKLYFDPRLSSTGTISCNTCHNVMEGGDDSRPTSAGVHGQTGPVNAPTVWNSGFLSTQFWDGRAPTLAEQAKGPLTASVEMGMPDYSTVLNRIEKAGYGPMYEEVYGTDEITLNRTVDAIAAYERTLVTPNSSYDEYVRGDADALTDQQIRGMETFESFGCTSCHSGPAFNGPQWQMEKGEFYGQEVPADPTDQCSEYVDEYNLDGQGRAGVTGDEADQGVWKVPTLRNVEHTAPYMHSGEVENLSTAIRIMGSCQLGEDPTDQEVEDMRAFFTSLTGEYPEQTLPRLPEQSGESIIESSLLRNVGPDATDGGAEETTEATTEADQGGADDGGDETTETTAGNGVGFSIVAAVAALAIAVALVARREL